MEFFFYLFSSVFPLVVNVWFIVFLPFRKSYLQKTQLVVCILLFWEDQGSKWSFTNHGNKLSSSPQMFIEGKIKLELLRRTQEQSRAFIHKMRCKWPEFHHLCLHIVYGNNNRQNFPRKGNSCHRQPRLTSDFISDSQLEVNGKPLKKWTSVLAAEGRLSILHLW